MSFTHHTPEATQPGDYFAPQPPAVPYHPTPSTDGAFWCCKCHFEIEITHSSGSSPFGHLQCRRCNHVFCAHCHHTTIISEAHNNQRDNNFLNHVSDPVVLVPAFNSHLVPYGQVCSGCGKTHRARKIVGRKPHRWFSHSHTEEYTDQFLWLDYSVVCECGTASSSGWFRFRIGSNRDWKQSTIACYQSAPDARLQISCDTAQARIEVEGRSHIQQEEEVQTSKALVRKPVPTRAVTAPITLHGALVRRGAVHGRRQNSVV